MSYAKKESRKEWLGSPGGVAYSKRQTLYKKEWRVENMEKDKEHKRKYSLYYTTGIRPTKEILTFREKLSDFEVFITSVARSL